MFVTYSELSNLLSHASQDFHYSVTCNEPTNSTVGACTMFWIMYVIVTGTCNLIFIRNAGRGMHVCVFESPFRMHATPSSLIV